MSKNRYTPEEILAMASGKRAADADADFNADGSITAEDAQLLDAKISEATKYATMRDELLDELLDGEAFTYDLNADALYRQYRDAYTREGALAAEDTAGRAGTMTGGYGNSYAVTAAAEAYNSYLQELNDRAPALAANAYARYADRRNAMQENVKTLSALDRENYDRFRDDIDDENRRETLAYDQRQDAISLAFRAAEQGDYSRLEEIGIDTQKLREDDRTAAAVLRAQYGDYSGLKQIGVDTAPLQAAADKKEVISVSIQNGAEETYAYYGYYALVRYLNRQITYGQLTEKGKSQVLAALTGG